MALEILKQNPDIELIFTDVVIPGGINGGQLAKKARVIKPGVKILFTSGYFSDQTISIAIPKEKVFVLNKPYRLKDLALKVRGAIDSGSKH